jgi:hypothetical protein
MPAPVCRDENDTDGSEGMLWALSVLWLMLH